MLPLNLLFGIGKSALGAWSNHSKAKTEAKKAAQLEDIRTGGEVAATRAKSLWATIADLILVALLLTPIFLLAGGLYFGNPMQVETTIIFFDHFDNLPSFYETLLLICIGGIYGVRFSAKGLEMLTKKGKK